MNEILIQLKDDFQSAASIIKAQNADKNANIADYRKEYFENDRELRESQIGKVQKDKTVKAKTGEKLVRVVKVPIAFAKKIVRTSTAFEVGNPATIIPSEQNELSLLVAKMWKGNRIDHLISKMITQKKSETQAAVQLYMVDIDPKGFFNKMLASAGITQKKTIKAKLLDNKNGVMYPYFDANGDMILFMWEYSYMQGSKSISFQEVWTKEDFYQYRTADGKTELVDNKVKKHGFDRIPIVYVSQDNPEWFDVKELIDRYEVSISKLGSSNDYFAHPILATYGKVESMPDKDESGKVINFPMKVDPNDPTKYSHGDAKFLQSDSDGASKTLELDTLSKNIHAISSTPDLSFENVKGIGTVSGAAIKLMFMDAIIKASTNEGDNRTMYERLLNIIISGIITTTNTGLKNQSEQLYFDIQFNSIIPSEFKETVDWVSSLKEKGLLSRETALKILDLADPAEEIVRLNEESNPQPVNQ